MDGWGKAAETDGWAEMGGDAERGKAMGLGEDQESHRDRHGQGRSRDQEEKREKKETERAEMGKEVDGGG